MKKCQILLLSTLIGSIVGIIFNALNENKTGYMIIIGIIVGLGGGSIYIYFFKFSIQPQQGNEHFVLQQRNEQEQEIQIRNQRLDILNERKRIEKEREINNYVKKAQTEYTKSKCLLQIAQDGKNKVIFIGNTGVGKSSLINKLYKLNLKTGKLQTTFGYEKVHTINNTIEIYDSQGYNQDNHDQQVKKWEQLNYYKIIFILYQDTLKVSKTMIECICKPKDRVYKVYFVCTKCDLWDDSNNKTMDQEIEQQRKYLKSIGVPNADKIQFFKSSARKDEFDGGVNENQTIGNLIKQLKQGE